MAFIMEWWQFITVFVLVCYLALVQEPWPIPKKSIWEIIQGAAAVVVVFFFLSSGKGCDWNGSSTEGCRPAGPGIYNDC